MDADIYLTDPSKALDISSIRHQLVRLEDTIIFFLIERLQFPLNATIYEPGRIKIPNSTLSLLDWVLWERERLDSLIRRYQSPDEYPFFPDAVQKPIIAPLTYPKLLHPNNVNMNSELKKRYTKSILPHLLAMLSRADLGESKENYGSAVTADVACLQALSRRIHYGKFVAESKFRSNPELFTKLIKAKDRQGLEDAITDRAVEQTLLSRLRSKVLSYGTDPGCEDGKSPSKIDVDAVVAMYRDHVIPLTKEVEVTYLIQRMDGVENGADSSNDFHNFTGS